MIVNCAPRAGDILAPDAAALGREQSSGNRETEARAGGMPHLRTPIERLEQMIEIGRVEPGPMIPDDEMRAVGLRPGPHDDWRRVRGRVSGRVLEQVGKGA